MRIRPPFTILALLLTGLLFSQCGGCLADPWPEPDPSSESADDDMAGGDDDSDDDDDDTDEPFPPDPPDARTLLCSAPVPAGEENAGSVTVVGLAGAVTDVLDVVVRGSDSQEAVISVSPDGSFAGRLDDVADGEQLTVAALDEDVESEPVSLTAGTLAGETAAGGGILGDGVVQPPDAEDQVAISGDGPRLTSGALVVGGNLDASTAATTLVIGDQFDLFIGGESGDLVDLFLVAAGQRSGFTDVDTVEVP